MKDTDAPLDALLSRLAELPVPEPPEELSLLLRAEALRRFRPRPLHVVWVALALASCAGYLGAAVYFVVCLS